MQVLNTKTVAFRSFQARCLAKTTQTRIQRAHLNMDKRHDELMQAYDELIEITRLVNEKLAAK